MALDKNSNGFTFGFAIILVVVVGAALSLTAMGLKPMQDKNATDKKMIDIIGAVNVQATRANAQEMYTKHVKESFVVDSEGNIKEGVDAFGVDVKKEYKDKSLSAADKNYPVFVTEVEGETYYVLPLAGVGLWGPIWGFVGLKGDYQTVFGAKFDHKGETPGLGAEIKKDIFQAQFADKQLNYGGDLLFEVTKGAGSSSTNYQVDGITGGTITSKGVEEMLNRCLGVYSKYFEKLKAAEEAKATEVLEAVEEVVEEATSEVQTETNE